VDIFDTPMLKKGAYGCFGERELGAGDSNPCFRIHDLTL
jgi:hypothetical protein